jgi:hypothetical protein
VKALKILSYVGKLAGFVAALDAIPFVEPPVGAVNCRGDRVQPWNASVMPPRDRFKRPFEFTCS